MIEIVNKLMKQKCIIAIEFLTIELKLLFVIDSLKELKQTDIYTEVC